MAKSEEYAQKNMRAEEMAKKRIVHAEEMAKKPTGPAVPEARTGNTPTYDRVIPVRLRCRCA